jgi:predicted GH43/DUF377 family glycosyl hydrolase
MHKDVLEIQTTAIDPASLISAKHHFNCAIHPWGDHFVLAYRIEHEPFNTRTRTAICELDRTLQPLPGTNKLLDLPTIHGLLIADDPRLISIEGRLHCSYTDRGRIALARLSCELTVDAGKYIRYTEDVGIHKNWAVFEHDSKVYAVHTICPHKILEIDLQFDTEHTATLRHQFDYSSQWSWGQPRGGTTPVRVGEEYFCFFHSHYHCAEDPGRIYVMGAYAFEACPPFKVTRLTRAPLLHAPQLPVSERAPNGHLVVFPCGAILDATSWLVSYGENDKWCKIGVFKHEDLLELMDPVTMQGPKL